MKSPASFPDLLRCAGFVTAVVASFSCFGQAAAPLTPALPQPPGFSSKPVLIGGLTGDAVKEAVVIDVNIAPGSASPMHMHPGECFGFVVAGAIEVLVEGQPPKRVETGQAFTNLKGSVHGFRNAGDAPVKLVNFLVVEKGKPRTAAPSQ